MTPDDEKGVCFICGNKGTCKLCRRFKAGQKSSQDNFKQKVIDYMGRRKTWNSQEIINVMNNIGDETLKSRLADVHSQESKGDDALMSERCL